MGGSDSRSGALSALLLGLLLSLSMSEEPAFAQVCEAVPFTGSATTALLAVFVAMIGAVFTWRAPLGLTVDRLRFRRLSRLGLAPLLATLLILTWLAGPIGWSNLALIAACALALAIALSVRPTHPPAPHRLDAGSRP